MRRWSLVVTVVLVASLVFPAAASAASAQWGGFWHVVQPGQTVFSIGRLYDVSPYAIATANALPNWNVIYAGQWLWIPSSGYTPGGYCARSHYVSRGETLLGIGRWYGVSAWSIAQANGIYDLNRIYAGTWLCIP
ncbi:MAG TPA: LysM domain-containing protein [Anaerolineae bacterium]